MVINGKQIRAARRAFFIDQSDMANALDVTIERLDTIERDNLLLRTPYDFEDIVESLKDKTNDKAT